MLLYEAAAGADPIWSEPESASGPRTSWAAKKSGGSATLNKTHGITRYNIKLTREYLGDKWMKIWQDDMIV